MEEAVVLAAPKQVGDNAMMKAKEMMGKLETGNLTLHGDLVAEKAAHAPALLDNGCLQGDMTMVDK